MDWFGIFYWWSGLTFNSVCICTIYDHRVEGVGFFRMFIITIIALIYLPISIICYIIALIILVFTRMCRSLNK